MQRVTLMCLVLLAVAAPVAAAQTADEQLVRGDSLHLVLDPVGALTAYRAGLALEPTDVELLWRAARSQVDIAKQIVGDDRDDRETRDSIYGVAREFADRAVAADSANADARFAVALVLGQQSRTKRGQERVHFGRAIYDEAARAIALDPTHDGAHHILGAWHAEVKRLSAIERFFAKTFMGARFMDRADWDSAAVHLERAVELNPEYIYHHLELAQIYVDVDRYRDARAQLDAIPALPDGDVLDPQYREDAARLREEIRDKS